LATARRLLSRGCPAVLWHLPVSNQVPEAAVEKWLEVIPENKIGRKQIILLFSDSETNYSSIQRNFNEEIYFIPGFTSELRRYRIYVGL
jgi:hypothetical protein